MDLVKELNDADLERQSIASTFYLRPGIQEKNHRTDQQFEINVSELGSSCFSHLPSGGQIVWILVQIRIPWLISNLSKANLEVRTHKTAKVPNIGLRIPLCPDYHFGCPKALRLNHFRKAIQHQIRYKTLNQMFFIKFS